MRRSLGPIVVGLVTLFPLEAAAHASATASSPAAQAPRGPRAGAGAPEASPPSRPARPRVATRGSMEEERRYTEKSRRANEARNFRAGDDVVIYVGATTLAIILAVVLILVLL
jgi:hypothetical protein